MNIGSTFIELPSTPMQAIYRTIQQVADSDLSFFIIGETGVGKEGIARYIHKKGPRRGKPFVAINNLSVSGQRPLSNFVPWTGNCQRNSGALDIHKKCCAVGREGRAGEFGIVHAVVPEAVDLACGRYAN